MDSHDVEKAGRAAEREAGEDGIGESGFHQTLDGLRIVRLHDDAGVDSGLAEKLVDDRAHVAALGVKNERGSGHFLQSDGSDAAAGDARVGGAQDEQLLLEQGQDF